MPIVANRLQLPATGRDIVARPASNPHTGAGKSGDLLRCIHSNKGDNMKKPLAYLIVLGMLLSPCLCLISTLQAAPTPAHRAEVKAQAPNPAADWTITALAFGAVVVGVVVVGMAPKRRPNQTPAGPDIDANDLAILGAITTMTPSGGCGGIPPKRPGPGASNRDRELYAAYTRLRQ